MGIYVFKKAVLLDLLCRAFPDAKDFSRDILAVLAGSIKIAAYPHSGYWEDVGSLVAYYNANLALARSVSGSSLFVVCWRGAALWAARARGAARRGACIAAAAAAERKLPLGAKATRAPLAPFLLPPPAAAAQHTHHYHT